MLLEKSFPSFVLRPNELLAILEREVVESCVQLTHSIQPVSETLTGRAHRLYELRPSLTAGRNRI